LKKKNTGRKGGGCASEALMIEATAHGGWRSMVARRRKKRRRRRPWLREKLGALKKGRKYGFASIWNRGRQRRSPAGSSFAWLGALVDWKLKKLVKKKNTLIESGCQKYSEEFIGRRRLLASAIFSVCCPMLDACPQSTPCFQSAQRAAGARFARARRGPVDAAARELGHQHERFRL